MNHSAYDEWRRIEDDIAATEDDAGKDALIDRQESLHPEIFGVAHPDAGDLARMVGVAAAMEFGHDEVNTSLADAAERVLDDERE